MKSILILLAIFVLIGCETTEEAVVKSGIKDISYTDCKTSSGQVKDSNFTIINWEYDGVNIKINHVNAGFNCCPGKLDAKADFNTGQIFVTESEESAGCKCNCLFDLKYTLTDIKKGVITLIIEEPYVDDAERINFSIDLNKENSGRIMIPRDEYPWNR